MEVVCEMGMGGDSGVQGTGELMAYTIQNIMFRLCGSSVCRTVGINSTVLCVKAPILSASSIHTGLVMSAWAKPTGPKSWLNYNKKIFPPQDPSEERRPAYVCHSRANIRISPKKLWYSACFIRGMSIDEAIKQLDFLNRKVAVTIKEVLLEAQELAVQDHNVEFKSNLWVAESFLGKGQYIKGIRRHARKRFGIVEYKHSHYFVRLEEGEPPKHYYAPPKTGEEMLESWMTQMRERRIKYSL
ncbi:hypothetical protein B566_EDAN000677 [Ephemera danica]|nr:hypothetical protein B566_EDAN000677 [Ephemera danica]